MPTTRELGEFYRQKYPDSYADADPVALGEFYRQKYPDSYASVSDPEPEFAGPDVPPALKARKFFEQGAAGAEKGPVYPKIGRQEGQPEPEGPRQTGESEGARLARGAFAAHPRTPEGGDERGFLQSFADTLEGAPAQAPAAPVQRVRPPVEGPPRPLTIPEEMAATQAKLAVRDEGLAWTREAKAKDAEARGRLQLAAESGDTAGVEKAKAEMAKIRADLEPRPQGAAEVYGKALLASPVAAAGGMLSGITGGLPVALSRAAGEAIGPDTPQAQGLPQPEPGEGVPEVEWNPRTWGAIPAAVGHYVAKGARSEADVAAADKRRFANTISAATGMAVPVGIAATTGGAALPLLAASGAGEFAQGAEESHQTKVEQAEREKARAAEAKALTLAPRIATRRTVDAAVVAGQLPPERAREAYDHVVQAQGEIADVYREALKGVDPVERESAIKLALVASAKGIFDAATMSMAAGSTKATTKALLSGGLLREQAKQVLIHGAEGVGQGALMTGGEFAASKATYDPERTLGQTAAESGPSLVAGGLVPVLLGTYGAVRKHLSPEAQAILEKWRAEHRMQSQIEAAKAAAAPPPKVEAPAPAPEAKAAPSEGIQVAPAPKARDWVRGAAAAPEAPQEPGTAIHAVDVHSGEVKGRIEALAAGEVPSVTLPDISPQAVIALERRYGLVSRALPDGMREFVKAPPPPAKEPGAFHDVEFAPPQPATRAETPLIPPLADLQQPPDRPVVRQAGEHTIPDLPEMLPRVLGGREQREGVTIPNLPEMLSSETFGARGAPEGGPVEMPMASRKKKERGPAKATGPLADLELVINKKRAAVILPGINPQVADAMAKQLDLVATPVEGAVVFHASTLEPADVQRLAATPEGRQKLEKAKGRPAQPPAEPPAEPPPSDATRLSPPPAAPLPTAEPAPAPAKQPPVPAPEPPPKPIVLEPLRGHEALARELAGQRLPAVSAEALFDQARAGRFDDEAGANPAERLIQRAVKMGEIKSPEELYALVRDAATIHRAQYMGEPLEDVAKATRLRRIEEGAAPEGWRAIPAITAAQYEPDPKFDFDKALAKVRQRVPGLDVKVESLGKDGDEGQYLPGTSKITINRDAIGSERQLNAILVGHEATHLGGRSEFGKRWDEVRDGIMKSRFGQKLVAAWKQERAEQYPQYTDPSDPGYVGAERAPRMIVDEALATTAQHVLDDPNYKPPAAYKMAVAGVKDWMRQHRVKLGWSDSDVAALIARFHEASKRPANMENIAAAATQGEGRIAAEGKMAAPDPDVTETMLDWRQRRAALGRVGYPNGPERIRGKATPAEAARALEAARRGEEPLASRPRRQVDTGSPTLGQRLTDEPRIEDRLRDPYLAALRTAKHILDGRFAPENAARHAKEDLDRLSDEVDKLLAEGVPESHLEAIEKRWGQIPRILTDVEENPKLARSGKMTPYGEMRHEDQARQAEYMDLRKRLADFDKMFAADEENHRYPNEVASPREAPQGASLKPEEAGPPFDADLEKVMHGEPTSEERAAPARRPAVSFRDPLERTLAQYHRDRLGEARIMVTYPDEDLPRAVGKAVGAPYGHTIDVTPSGRAYYGRVELTDKNLPRDLAAKVADLIAIAHKSPIHLRVGNPLRRVSAQEFYQDNYDEISKHYATIDGLPLPRQNPGDPTVAEPYLVKFGGDLSNPVAVMTTKGLVPIVPNTTHAASWEAIKAGPRDAVYVLGGDTGFGTRDDAGAYLIAREAVYPGTGETYEDVGSLWNRPITRNGTSLLHVLQTSSPILGRANPDALLRFANGLEDSAPEPLPSPPTSPMPSISSRRRGSGMSKEEIQKLIETDLPAALKLAEKEKAPHLKTGTPELASLDEKGYTPLGRAATELYTEKVKPENREKDVDVRAQADELLKDPTALEAAIKDRAFGSPDNPAWTTAHEVAAARLTTQRIRDAVRKGEYGVMQQAAELLLGTRLERAKTARLMRAMRDEAMTPAERAALYMGMALTTPPKAIRDVMNDPGRPQKERDVARDKWQRTIKRMVEDLRRVGYDPAKIMSDPKVLDDPREAARLLRVISTGNASVGDKIREYWINSILSGLKTHVVNLAGNISSIGAEVYTRFWEAGLNRARGGGQGVMPADYSLSNVHGVGIGEALSNAWKTALLSFETEVDMTHGIRPVIESRFRAAKGDKYDRGGPAIRGHIPGTNWEVGRGVRAPGRALTASDAFAQSLIGNVEALATARRMAREEYMASRKKTYKEFTKEMKAGELPAEYSRRVKELISDHNSEAWQEGTRRADLLTFKEELDKIPAAINAIKQGNGPAAMAATFLLPFIGVPYNIFKRAIHLSPLYAPVALAKAAKGKLDYAAQSRIMAEQMTGLLFLGLGLAGYGGWDKERRKRIAAGEEIEGITSGYDNYDVRNAAEREQAEHVRPPFSAEIAGHRFDYSRLDPLAAGMAINGELAKALLSRISLTSKGDEGTLGAATKVASSGLSPIASAINDQFDSKTFFQGLSNVMGVVNAREGEGANEAMKLLGSIIEGFSPNLLRQTGKAVPQVVTDRSYWGAPGYNEGETKGERLVRRLKDPMHFYLGEEPTGEPKVNVAGTYEPTPGNGIARWLSPAAEKVGDEHMPTVVREVRRKLEEWNTQNPDKKYVLPVVGKSVPTAWGTNYYLSDKELRQLREDVGYAVVPALQSIRGEIVNGPMNEEKIKLIKDTLRPVREDVIQAFRSKRALDVGAKPWEQGP